MENGCTALQRASADGHSEVVRILIQNGADPNRQDSLHGNTALHEAAWKGYSRCVALLATKAALHIRNNGGFAPLHLACQNGHNQTCREILLAGCEPDIQNNYGDTSLHTSARYGHAGVTRILISAECHVSDQNKNGDTALHIAAAMGRRKLTRILLEAGCSKSLKNKQNETAKDIAIRKELHEIVDILNMPTTKTRKEAKKRDKSNRDKSVERVLDTPDGADKSSKKKSKEKDLNQSPSKPKDKKRVKNVHFETNAKHWSPYGCHYYPDPRNFPKPKLDSLPKEPLKKGEQYFLDLAGNICKGPVGVGYTCYCAPFFKHMEDKLNRDKQELKHHIDKAHEKLDQKVANLEKKTQGQISELTRCVAAERFLCKERQQHLEQWLTRGMMFRVSERVRKLDFSPKGSVDIAPLKRTRSLEMLDSKSKAWNIIKTFNSKLQENQQPLTRKSSKSADLLDISQSKSVKSNDKFRSGECETNHFDRRKSVRMSDKSVSLASYAPKGSTKSSLSSHNVTAEIHANQTQSESDDRHSMHSKISSGSNSRWMTKEGQNRISTPAMNQSKKDYEDSLDIYEKSKTCLDAIENDGYIKISRCDENYMSRSVPSEGIPNMKNPDEVTVDVGSRRSVHELVARIQERQFIDELQRESRSPTREMRSPGIRSIEGRTSRSMSPNYQTPNQYNKSDWQNNTIPLSENTHFNTIEPINQTVQPTTSKAPQNAKSPKKFSFHNLIPFPTRKMFNFHHKSDGNQSESSDEEDVPIRSTLEPGLMQNSNLLTTLPLPNYENMMSNQNAQPQSPNKPNGHCINPSNNHLALRGSILPIPKDAYFHEIPNKQRFHDAQMFGGEHRFVNQHVHPHFNHQIKPNENVHINYSRNRNPVYSSNGLLGEMMHDHMDRELSRTPQSYTNQLDQNAEIEISNICMQPMMANSHGHLMAGQMLNFPSHLNENHLSNRMQNLAINTHLSELQSQLDRDSHNDSGYSTKVYGSSQGASPSLSGNVDCSENVINQKMGLAINRNITNSSMVHPHIGASSLV
ncbi:ankyrin repeat domain containing protein 6 diego [Arctopsyche grandis]|uniref:ankyrin repeat domain containing protein 6 diego n=1 Tax=Arctopsyche grandis TaxID=121162 RepID=UPI00406D7821